MEMDACGKSMHVEMDACTNGCMYKWMLVEMDACVNVHGAGLRRHELLNQPHSLGYFEPVLSICM